LPSTNLLLGTFRVEREEGQTMSEYAVVLGVITLAVVGVFTALAGGIHAYWITFLDPESAFDITLNVKMIIMAVFGGPGTVLGPVVGALVLSGVSEVLASKATGVASLFYGFVIVAAVVLMPKGILDLMEGFRTARWRYFTDNVRRFRL
jgi:branched-chain amino acid transport system permease protein